MSNRHVLLPPRVPCAGLCRWPLDRRAAVVAAVVAVDAAARWLCWLWHVFWIGVGVGGWAHRLKWHGGKRNRLLLRNRLRQRWKASDDGWCGCCSGGHCCWSSSRSCSRWRGNRWRCSASFHSKLCWDISGDLLQADGNSSGGWISSNAAWCEIPERVHFRYQFWKVLMQSSKKFFCCVDAPYMPSRVCKKTQICNQRFECRKHRSNIASQDFRIAQSMLLNFPLLHYLYEDSMVNNAQTDTVKLLEVSEWKCLPCTYQSSCYID